MVIFGKNCPQEKFWRSIGKLEHWCTTTNLPLCSDTIIVLKIILLHSVSVITNFVIPKRDKKTKIKKKRKNEQKTSHFFVYSRRSTHDPHHTCMVIEEDCPIFAPPNFFDPVSIFAARSYWKLVGKCPHRWKMLVFPPKATKLKS